MANLLVVDSCERDHDRYRSALAELELDLRFCTTGREAEQRLEATPNLAGVLVLWELTGVPTGPELIGWLRHRWPETPVVAVSGLLDLTRAARARDQGAADFLLKPLDCQRLLEAVRNLLRAPKTDPVLTAMAERLVGESAPFRRTLDRLAPLINTHDEPVLLIGENGTGKEGLAKLVHDLGARDQRRWTPVNVACIPATLIETALFGHEAGSFTGASDRHVGYFEESGQGTLFLDEIGELEMHVQAKLLRVLQERTFRRVGGSQDLSFQARLVCATNRDLVAEQAAGRFRPDLYHRISADEVRLPALRERGSDLWLLVEHFFTKHASGRKIRLAREASEMLEGYSFLGNIRELENLIRHALHACQGAELLPFHFPVEIMERRQGRTSAADEEVAWPERWRALPYKEALTQVEQAFDRAYLPKKLQEAKGNITRASRAAGLDPKTFRKRWSQCGLPPLVGEE